MSGTVEDFKTSAGQLQAHAEIQDLISKNVAPTYEGLTLASLHAHRTWKVGRAHERATLAVGKIPGETEEQWTARMFRQGIALLNEVAARGLGK